MGGGGGEGGGGGGGPLAWEESLVRARRSVEGDGAHSRISAIPKTLAVPTSPGPEQGEPSFVCAAAKSPDHRLTDPPSRYNAPDLRRIVELTSIVEPSSMTSLLKDGPIARRDFLPAPSRQSRQASRHRKCHGRPTRDLRDNLRMNSLVLPLLLQIDRGGGAIFPPCISRSQTDWPRLPCQPSEPTAKTKCLSFRLEPDRRRSLPIRRASPTPPIAGVGRMALPPPSSALVSL